MSTMFGWKDYKEAYGPFPPITVVSITLHTARVRQHICAECFAPIHIGNRYSCTIYKEMETGKLSQFKCHVTCPYDAEV